MGGRGDDGRVRPALRVLEGGGTLRVTATGYVTRTKNLISQGAEYTPDAHPVGYEFRQDVMPQDGRSISVRATLRF